ncbi:kinase-like domain-containing protein, partial [Coemansia spiralis]
MASAHSDQYSGHGSDSIAVLPLLPKTLAESVSSSQTNHLSVTTKDLRLTPSRRSQHRSSISNSAALAMPTMPSINDFVLLKPISKGAYGSVFLAKKRATGEYYAIKILKKADMIAKNQISNVKAERAIMMAQTGSPFVVRLLYTFQSRTNLYLVMEYLNGGDCASLLKAIGTLPENWAQQYLAEVVLGVEDLHARNVVHRDLKPDNLLIDSEGHLKLTDFGLSKLGFLGRRVDQQAHKHALGTPDYIAPESILGLEAGESVDWWALGIICYEFIFGIPPFHDETPEKQSKSDSEEEDDDEDDDTDVPDISPEARDFITRLLCRDPKRRLGYNGAEEVKAHPMFKSIDWATILETQAAFVPQVENIEDTDYFDSR